MSRPSSSRRRPALLVSAAASALLCAGLLTAAPAAASPGITMPTDASAGTFAGFTDKTPLESKGRDVVSSGILPVEDGSAPAGSGITYYVDADAGDDSADGTSAATAWQSFTNVNDRTFGPGDRILLKAGSVWAAEGTEVSREAYDYTTWSGGAGTDVEGTDATALLAPGGSGTAEHPIVLSSYGDGAAPELNGRGVVNDVLQLTNQSHWDISNLEISNETAGFDPSDFTPASAYGQVPGQEDPLTGDLRGIHVQGENAGSLTGFDIHDVFVRDVSGVTWSVSGAGLDRSKRTGGIIFEGLKGDATTASTFEDVTVRDSVIANTSFANLTFKQFAGMGTNRYQDLSPGWGDRAVAKAAADGTITEDPDWRPHTDIHITGNYLTNRDTEYGWDAMYLTSIKGAVVEGNVVDGAGVSGIEMYYADDIVVQDNEVAELATRTGAADSNGIDPDRGTSNILIQGNYVHDSGEGILLCGFGFGTAVVRYNIIQDVDRNYINPHGNSGVNVIYNNLMYNTVAPLKNNTVGFFESSGSASDYLVARNPHHVIGNVFYNARASVAGAAFRTEFPGVHFAGNSYFGPQVTAPAADATAATADPLLGGDPADDIRNAAVASYTSPLVGAGTDVDLAAIAPGFDTTGGLGTSLLPLAVDFFGEPLPETGQIGPVAYRPADGHGLVAGTVTDAAGVAVPGATVAGGSVSVTTDARGRFVLELPVGEHVLTASATDYEPGQGTTISLAEHASISRDLALGATTTTKGTLSGTVSSAGSPLADAIVELSLDDAVIAETHTDASGGYAFAGVEAGDGYAVTARRDGYQDSSVTGLSVSAARTTDADLILRTVVAETSYAISESFDDEGAGAFSGTADGMLVAKTNAAVGTITVEEDQAQAGNKYLRINKSSSSSGVLGVHNTEELDLTGTVTIQARLQRTTTNTTANQLALYSYTESGWNAAAPASSTNPSATIGFSGGRIMTHNVTGASTVKNVTDYVVGRWYTVRNVVDLDAGTFDFYVDDMTTPLLTDQPLRTKVDDLDHFLFYINGSNVGDLLIDDFRVNTGVPFEADDAALGAATVRIGDEDVELTPSVDGLTLTGTVDAFAEKATVGAAADSPFAAVSVDGTIVTDENGVEVALDGADPDVVEIATRIPVVVTAEDGSTRAYTVVLSRTNPSQLAALGDVRVDGLELSPAFDPYRQGSDSPYVVTEEVAAGTTSVRVEVNRGWNGQPVQIDGVELPADESGATIPLAVGENTIEITAGSFAGDVGTYSLLVTRAAAQTPDTTKPVSTLTSPTTTGPHRTLAVSVDASDDRGLQRIVANIYRGSTLVKSTQTAMDGARSGTHSATVALPDGDYTIRYNAQDLAGNISQTRTYAVTIDGTAPTVTVKSGAGETVGTGGVYTRLSVKLYDAGRIDRVTINGTVKDLVDNAWSDVNGIVPGTFGAVRGENTLVVHDVAGNTTTLRFTLE
ncbi:carboxypeptidase regulatory-like domain-containing protein [Microbacterium sp. NPDC055903]